MPGDVQLTALQIEPAPLDYLVPGSAVVRVKSIRGEFTDNSALADWLPAVQLISDSGHVIATASDQGAKVTAGGSADASFFPGAAKAAAAAGAASLPSYAIANMSGVGSIALPDNTATNVNLLGADFDTNDSARYTIEADSGTSGVSSISIHKIGAYRVDVAVSVQRTAAGMTLAQAQAAWVGVNMKQDGVSPHHARAKYADDTPSGSYGFVDPFGAGGYWWTCVTTWFWTVSGTNTDLTTHPIYIRVRCNSGFANFFIDGCFMCVTELDPAGFV